MTIRILLVEDDVDHALLVSRGLPAAQGFEVVHVRTGADALEAAAHEPFDICLVDHRLPDREGIGLCRELREASGAPVLMVTGAGQEFLAQRAFEAGAEDFIVKGTGFVKRLADEVNARVGGEHGEGRGAA